MSADVVLITKIDLAAAVEFNAVVANRNIQVVRPRLIVLDVTAKSGGGMEEFLDSFGRAERLPAWWRPLKVPTLSRRLIKRVRAV